MKLRHTGWSRRSDADHALEVCDLKFLAQKTATDLARILEATGEQATVIVAVATDNDGHSRFGLKCVGSCLRVDGLAEVVRRAAADGWQPAEREVDIVN